MSEIDSLDIKISAEAQSADKALGNLITKLDKLSNSLGSINTNGLSEFSNGISRLGNSMQSISNVKTTEFTRLAKNIGKLGNIDASSINSAAISLSNMTNALGGIGAVSQSAEQVGQLSSAIAKLGYKSVGNAINNMPLLANGLRDLMQTLSTAPMVSNNLIQMTNALSNFASMGSRVGSSSRSLISGLNGYSVGANKASKSSMSLARAFGKFFASWWLVIRGFNQIKKAIDISADLTEVQNVVDVTFGDMAYKVEEFAKTSIADFGMSELALKKYSSRFQAMGSAMGINNDSIRKANDYLSKMTNGYIEAGGSMADMSLNLTKLTADMSSFYNVSQEDVAKDLEAIFTGQTRPLRTYGLDLTQATLAEWAMKQGLDANVQSMSQAEKTLLRYQYVLANTSSSQNDFQRTMGTWSNQTRILTMQLQQLGSVIGQTFINALKPALKAMNAFLANVIQFAQTIGNALGKIFGWKYEVSGGGLTEDIDGAASGADDLADGLGSAASNAKKLKTHLLGIDELNVLEPQEDTASGGGGGSTGGIGGGSSSNAMGQWVKEETPYESMIDSLYELGEYIGQTLTDAMNNINWESIYERARNFGKGLAEFLNGLISPELFGALGQTIAGSLNTALNFLNSFGTEFEWDEFGESIATGVNRFFETFDFAELANTIDTWVQGAWTTIKKAINGLDWPTIWDGVEEFISNIDIETVEIIIGAFVLKYAGKLLTASILKKTLSGKIASLLTTAGISTTALATAGAGLTIGMIAIVGFKFAEDAKTWWENVQEYGWRAGARKTADENAANPYLMRSGGGRSFDDEESTNIFSIWKEKIAEWQETNRIARDEEHSAFATWADETGQKISTSWQENVIPWFSLEKWAELGSGIMQGISLKWDEFKAWWSETAMVTWFEENVRPWFSLEKWSEIGQGILGGISLVWEEVKTWWRETAMVTWIEEDVKPWFSLEKWNKIYDTIRTALENKWNETLRFWNAKENLSTVQFFIEDLLSKVKSVWNSVVSWWNQNTYPLTVQTTVHESSSGRTHGGGGGRGFATGGFPETASYFWAGENGVPEILGTIGGRTAVAGGVEITGIREEIRAQREDIAQLTNILVPLVQIIAEKDPALNIDGRELVSAFDNRKNRNGYDFRYANT